MSHVSLSANVMQVVAGVIERDGKILIGQRKSTGRHPLKWEFPGGKVEPGEDPRAALVRELREELAIEVKDAEPIDSYDFQYPGGPVTRLLFYRVIESAGEPVNLDFEQIVWCPAATLRDYDFLEGDIRFIESLKVG